MTQLDQLLLCEFRLAHPLQASTPLIGSRISLELEVPPNYAGGSVGTLKFLGRVVSVNDAPHSGWTNVVCQVEEMETGEPEKLSAAS